MKIVAIAINTFREAIRDKILYSLLFFAVLMIGASVIVGELSLGDQGKIVKDVGLASISIFGNLIAVFVGIGLVYKEIEGRTIYTILSKPIYRAQFIVGKFVGLALTLAAEITVMTLCFLALLVATGSEFGPEILIAIVFIYLQLLVITSFAVLFSSFSTPTLSAIFTLSIFIIGSLSGDIKLFGARSKDPMMQTITDGIYLLLPNLDNFNFKGQVVYDIPVPTEQYLFSLSYGLIYTTVILVLATFIFSRRDFK